MSKTAIEGKKPKPIVLIVYGVLGLLLLVSFILTNSFVQAADKENKRCFGYYISVVRSNDMSATNFKLGDVVLSRQVDASTLHTGEIITFRSANPGSVGQLVSHKIRSISTDTDGTLLFETYNTLNGASDSMPVRADQIIGKCMWSLPDAGYFVILMQYVPATIHVFVLIVYLLGAVFFTYRYLMKRIACSPTKADKEVVAA